MNVHTRKLKLHGDEMHYRHYVPAQRARGRSRSGADRDAIVLLHGIASSSRTWQPLLDELAARRCDREVIALDLLGHGESSAPTADYSLGLFATAVRDLLALHGHRRVTLVGHSLGGAVAMQFAYTFPQLCGRLVLVSSGGLGKDVLPLIRAANLPGAGLALTLLTNPATLTIGTAFTRLSSGWSAEDREFARCISSLADPGRRAAYIRTARSTTDLGGQREGATARLHLAELVPTLIVWGGKDWIIPIRHAFAAAKAMPGSRLEIIPAAEHFPHVALPQRFAQLLTDFAAHTKPATVTADSLADHLRRRRSLEAA